MSTSGARRSILLTLSRTRRRVLVIAVYLLLFGCSAALAFGVDSWRILVTILVAEAIYMVLYFRYISPINKEITNKTDEYLDERQIAIRDRAHYHAYQILGTFLILIVMLPVVASDFAGTNFPISFTHRHWVALYAFYIQLFISLPASVVAWMEPDPRPDE